MQLTAGDFDYDLPPELIAQEALEGRDQSRLMVLSRRGTALEHLRFSSLPALLRPGDLLVLNDTRVVPARFFCHRVSGGAVEGLFLRETDAGDWEVMLRKAGRCRPAERLKMDGAEGRELELLQSLGKGRWRVRCVPPAGAMELLQRVGRTPLPPYIRREDASREPVDRQRYQTVYAARPGAVAAPTAGLHFSRELLAALTEMGVRTATVTLHVGPGTFAPVKVDDPARHPMHSEWYDLPAATAEAVVAARDEGRRVVAVGTTSVRVMESVAAAGEIRPASGWTDLFLYPPATFRAVDALITNFHLPRSTLLMLVAAFCSPGSTEGTSMILDAYAEAVRRRYRFYSYGDAMLIR